MTLRIVGNNAASTLAVAISTTGQTTAQVQSGDAAKFPSLTPGHTFHATLTHDETSWEIVKCTALSTDTFTIERGKEGTTAATWAIGDKFELRLTKELVDYYGRSHAERQIGQLFSTSSTNAPSGPGIFISTTLGTWTAYTMVAGSTLAAHQKGVNGVGSALANTGGCGLVGDGGSAISRGSAAQHGGAYLRYRFVPVDIVAGNRLFIGANALTSVPCANGATEPSASGTDMFGLGCDSGDTNITIFSRSASGSATKTALSTPISYVSMVGKMYDLTVDWEPGVITTMHLKLVEWNGDTRTVLHDGVVSSAIPAADVLMRMHWGFGQGTDAAVLRQIRFNRASIEYSNPT